MMGYMREKLFVNFWFYISTSEWRILSGNNVYKNSLKNCLEKCREMKMRLETAENTTDTYFKDR